MTHISILRCFSKNNKSLLVHLILLFTCTFLTKFLSLFIILAQLWLPNLLISMFECVSCMKTYQGLFCLLRLCPYALRALHIMWLLTSSCQMQPTSILKSLLQYLKLLRPWSWHKKFRLWMTLLFIPLIQCNKYVCLWEKSALWNKYLIIVNRRIEIISLLNILEMGGNHFVALFSAVYVILWHNYVCCLHICLPRCPRLETC